MSPRDERCAECGRPRSEHCEFVELTVPVGCKCNPMDWGNPMSIPAVCGAYVDGPDDLCATCEHQPECHP